MATNPPKNVVLPREGQRNILITSALPYVNNVPHLGNIVGCVLSADVYARYCRARGYNIIYICGTDEYGTATETKALQEGLTPQQICDKYNAIHRSIYEWFNIGFDHFGRTTTPHQTKIAQDIFLKLDKNGLLIRDTIQQTYCEQCEKFLADRFVEGICPKCEYIDARGDQCDKCNSLLNATELINPRCKIDSNHTVVIRDTDHVFLDLPACQPKLAEFHAASQAKGIWTENTVQITRSAMNKGLERRCITRDLKWGTPVPLEEYKEKVFYVWFDAPIGYISITANYTDEWEQWWKNPDNVEMVQFMGKDNVPFHSIIFPASLQGADDGYTQLHSISTTEYLQYEGGKFSKSRSVGVFGDNAQETGIDVWSWRYFLMANRPESQDSNFDWAALGNAINGELLANLGNFINRSLKFTKDQFEGKIPRAGELSDSDKEFVKAVDEKIQEYFEAMEKICIRDGLRLVMAISALGNKHYQDNKPWELIKDGGDRVRAGTLICLFGNLVRVLAHLFEPFMPGLAAAVFEQLAYNPVAEAGLPESFKLDLQDHPIGTPGPLVKKLDKDTMEKWQDKFSPKEPEFILDLQFGKVVECTAHETAEKLYILQVDMGGKKPRQIVSGLREAYPNAEEVVGKNVCVLRNLKPRKFQGVQSHGMLLTCIGEDGTIKLLTVADVPPGTPLLAQGTEQKTKNKLDFKLFDPMVLRLDDDNQAVWEDPKKGGVHKLLTEGSQLPAGPDGGVVMPNARLR
eukprot:TRINITY_DN2263_c0_g1_i2.p1 TRINITY_DN2263_c0_g1~~TRINITY_DN2263_c0_g1_i2.p1  ORF type:complete len:744 (+),score=238.77 TRINITY_DN2263_c0_g1_i2:247-2478(+)